MWEPHRSAGSAYGVDMPSPPLKPRGPLPPRVYWTRRLVLLAMALVLVIGVAKLLGSSSDASDPSSEERAVTAGASTTSPATQTAAPRVKKKKRKKQTPTEPPLAEPTGPCANSDIVATPVVAEAYGDTDVAITLNLRALETPACTWTVSAETLTVSITSGDDFIWGSRHCPTSIPVQDVVVRQAVDAPVQVVWPGARRSDEDCSTNTDWALPGFYHVEAAALGGEPTDVQFELVVRPSEVITKTVTPKPRPQSKKSGRDTTSAPGESDTAHTPGEQGGGNSEG